MILVKRNYVFLVCVFNCMLIACNQSKKSSNMKEEVAEVVEVSPIFENFFKKFSPIKSNLEINTTCLDVTGNSNYKELDIDKYKELLDGYEGPAVSLGYLADTANFYNLIYCTASACYLPNLSVYDKSGQLLNTCLIASGCGSDVGYECSEKVKILNSNKIITTKVEKYYDYDSLGQISNTSIKKMVTKILYSVDVNGNIKADTIK